MLTDKIIVLGGSGFLGSHIIKALQKAGIGEVTSGDLQPSSSINCDQLKLDLLDINDTANKLGNYNVIVNCIGQITKPFNLCFTLNSFGIKNLIKALPKKDTRLIHISTVSVYGSADNCNEESLLNPETNYATAKAFAEQILLENYNIKKLTILRLSNLYGTNQKKGVFAYLLKSYNSDTQVLTLTNLINSKLKRSFFGPESIKEKDKKIPVDHLKSVSLFRGYDMKWPKITGNVIAGATV